MLRFKEKFCFFSNERKKGKLVWFHGASRRITKYNTTVGKIENKKIFKF